MNLAEGFLVEDDEPAYDAYTEQWWLDLNEFCRGVELEPTMRIRCRVQDESGKINVNLTRVTGTGPRVSEDQQVTRDAVVRDALRRLFEAHNIDVQSVDRLVEYWQQDPTELPDGTRLPVPDFNSLEDFGATLGIPTSQLRELRDTLTAQPRGFLRGININTAPAEVLSAVLNDAEAPSPRSSIASSRSSRSPEQRRDQRRAARRRVPKRLAQSVHGQQPPLPPRGERPDQRRSRRPGQRRHRADPERVGLPAPGRRPNRRDNSQGPRWTLRPLDWQKEGGARLFWQTGADADQSATPGATDTRDNSLDR